MSLFLWTSCKKGPYAVDYDSNTYPVTRWWPKHASQQVHSCVLAGLKTRDVERQWCSATLTWRAVELMSWIVSSCHPHIHLLRLLVDCLRKVASLKRKKWCFKHSTHWTSLPGTRWKRLPWESKPQQNRWPTLGAQDFHGAYYIRDLPDFCFLAVHRFTGASLLVLVAVNHIDP